MSRHAVLARLAFALGTAAPSPGVSCSSFLSSFSARSVVRAPGIVASQPLLLRRQPDRRLLIVSPLRNFITGPVLLNNSAVKAEPSTQSITGKHTITTTTVANTTTTKASINSTTSDATDEKIDDEFVLSEKAAKAAQLNLSARLSKREAPPKSAGIGEIVRLFKLARNETWSLSGAFVLLCFSSAVTLVIPFLIGKILDIATSESSTDTTMFGLSMTQFFGALGLIFIIGSAADFGRVSILRIVGERLVARLRSNLYKQTVNQDAEFFDANRVGDLISRLSSDANIVAKSLTQNVSDGLRAVVSGVAGLGLMAYVSLKLSAVMLLIVPPVGVFAFIYGRRIRNVARETQQALGSATKVAEERLSNIRTAQSFSGEISEVGRYNSRVREIFNLGKREAVYSAMFFSLTRLSGNITILGILAVGSQLVKSGSISIGDLSSFMMYAAYTGSSMFGLSSFYAELMKGVGASTRLFELEDRKPSIKTTVGKPVSNQGRGVIEFKDVVFAYPTRPAINIFEKLSFAIQPGLNVCIVGPSGGGKSTISQLLMRFYEPTSGSITIDGEDIRNFNLKSLRRTIGIVSQEPVLFSGTIAENISYGKLKATRAEITAAARKANCDFIQDFPNGLDTQVGSRGTQLSGGQKQRIAIARALIRDPSILILDEATSALDAESESAVNEALVRLMRSNTTTISIAHRLSTIMKSDYIIVLDGQGQVGEQGTFKELSSNPDSFFSKLLLDNHYAGTDNLNEIEERHQIRQDEDVLKEELEEELEEESEQQQKTNDRERVPLSP
ncbi:P-loop containing nucleoside triphosphate hydrolase protein [Lipomyces japonicus]|uniref:P-loop containing nucleoside triphosphate hydrolase protein n=1 Tax=Lipomyces japonicus TaxID=56871 RepID=UPI0034CF5597